MKNAVPGTFDFYYARGPMSGTSAVPFESAVIRRPTGTFSLTFRLQGNDPLSVTHTVSFSVRNAAGTHPLGAGSFYSKEAKTYTFAGLPSSWLVDGQNELVVVCDADYKYLINDFTINYHGSLRRDRRQARIRRCDPIYRLRRDRHSGLFGEQRVPRRYHESAKPLVSRARARPISSRPGAATSS